MASESEIKDIVTRVTAEVRNEAVGSEARFKVSDLSAHLRDIAKPDTQAWTISYTTAAAALADQGIRTAGVGEVAWSISYSTAAAALQDIVTKPGQK
jgi:hypothetical protein